MIYCLVFLLLLFFLKKNVIIEKNMIYDEGIFIDFLVIVVYCNLLYFLIEFNCLIYLYIFVCEEN